MGLERALTLSAIAERISWSELTRRLQANDQLEPEALAAPPPIELSLSNGTAGIAIRAYLIGRQGTSRAPRGVRVLTLAADPADYLKGRSRQAVRTNLRKAEGLGVRAARCGPAAARAAAREAIAAGLPILHLDAFAAEPHAETMEDWLGHDAAGRAIAFARVQIDRDVALLKCFVAVQDDERSVIRYRLAADLFRSLAERGVRYVILYAAFDPPPGQVYFSERLGFELADVRVRPSASSAGGAPSRSFGLPPFRLRGAREERGV